MNLNSLFQDKYEYLFYNNDLIINFDKKIQSYVELTRDFSNSVFETNIYPERTEEAKNFFGRMLLLKAKNKKQISNILLSNLREYDDEYESHTLNLDSINVKIDDYIKSLSRIGRELLPSSSQEKKHPILFALFSIVFIVLFIGTVFSVIGYVIGLNYLLDNHTMIQFTDYEDIVRLNNFKYKDIISAFMLIYAFCYVPIVFVYNKLIIKKTSLYFALPLFLTSALWIANFFSIAFFNPNLQLGMRMFYVFMAPSILSFAILLLSFFIGEIHKLKLHLS